MKHQGETTLLPLRSLLKRIANRRTQFAALSAAAAFCLLATTILTAQIFVSLKEYQIAHTDNVQWTVAKLESEHAKYLHAIENLRRDDPDSLKEMRRRFDILYSRAHIFVSAQTYRKILNSPHARETVRQLNKRVEHQATLIDGSDAQVFDNKEELLRQAFSLTEPVMRLSSIGIAYDVDRREAERLSLADKLIKLVGLSLILLASLFALLALFWQLYRRYRRRAMQNRTMLNRLATIFNTSQDVIMVIRPDGEILEGNRLAAAMFGPYDGNRLERNISEILVKRVDGKLKPVTGRQLIESCTDGPNLCTRLSARDKKGRLFPVELSANMASRSGDNVCICFLRDISQRVATEAEMQAARDKALAGERAKARFLGMISHEMRTPLNGMLGALDLLEETPLTQEQSRYTQIMHTSGQLVLNQINDALDVTQANGKRFALVKQRFDLDALLDKLVQGQQTHAKTQGTRINLLSPAEPLGYVMGDPNRLHQILLNLLSNAIKFTENGEVTVEATRLAGHGSDGSAPGNLVEFQISDTGIGIDEKDIDRVFEDFVRLESQSRVEGTGLGLGIVKHLTSLMGGKIGVESVRHEGSLFWVRIPLPLDAPPHEADASPDLPPPVMHPKIVLVVEDNDTSRFVVNEMLKKDGHEVVLAANGVDGVNAAGKRRFDLILMDINLPDIDGTEAVRRIRGGGGPSADSRIVALTAHFRAEDNQSLLAAQIDAICTKPIRRNALRDLLADKDIDAPAPQPQSEIDTQILDQLCAVLPHRNLSRALGDFTIEGEAILASLDRLANHPDQETVSTLHQFAGSAATFGAVALQSTICQAENMARAGDREGLARVLEGVPALWSRTIAEIDNHRGAA